MRNCLCCCCCLSFVAAATTRTETTNSQNWKRNQKMFTIPLSCSAFLSMSRSFHVHPHENYQFQFSTSNDKLTENFDVVANFIYKVFAGLPNKRPPVAPATIFQTEPIVLHIHIYRENHYWIYWESWRQEAKVISVFRLLSLTRSQ